MLQDHELFARLCEKRGISSIPEISDAIRVSSITGELRLSCLSIMIPVCEIIARMLVSSHTIRTIDLSDCMLLSKGLASILDALCEGTTVTTLHLKGNNVNGPAVAQLGRVFACNNTLKRLHIEWNSVGSDADSFTAFCDGLAKNHNIEQLDLRYNQISAHCAEHLCKIIRANKSLKSIDLSWNTLGLQGGRLLLNAMRENKTITDLVLRGNCISEDTALAIEERLRENRRTRATSDFVLSANVEIVESARTTEKEDLVASVMSDAHIPKQRLPTPHRREKLKIRARQVPADVSEVNSKDNSEVDSEVNAELEDDSKIDTNVGANVPSQDRDNRASETDVKIADLGKMLQERTQAIDLLTGEIATKATEVNDTRAQLDLLQTQVSRLQEDKEKLDSDKAREIAELRKNHDQAEENWRRSYKDLKNNFNECSRNKKEAESKVRRYETEIHRGSVKIDLMRDKLVSATRAYEDLLSKTKTEIHRLRRESRERDNKHKIEQNLLKTTLKETTQALEDCQLELQKNRRDSRDLSKSQALLKAKLDDAECRILRYTNLEGNYRKIEEEKNVLEEKLVDSQKIGSSLKRQIANLQSELIEPQRRENLLKEELELEKQTNERLKRELHEESARLKDQNLQMEKMHQQIAILNTQLNEVRDIHAEILREREKERKQFQDIISSKERNLSELRAEEVQRAGQLYAAFNKYLSSIAPNSNL
ncbi:PREDICTED: leucine-rich repeat-containing protein 45-like [Dinoponera quadriceps]|uniref:Leucine-rich repeat-containing protein 45-like n=1 Tax=Dinoponera quadriceps TaxID=609295 RepID=A0A6P3X8J4_DINQU|nr:PREDICTED: leucine-rich repeat-containing protein 45-like [Dinoponera quadriceps]